MKPIWKSKTIWFNVLSIAVELAQIIPPELVAPGTITIIVNAINIIIRKFTSEPLGGVK